MEKKTIKIYPDNKGKIIKELNINSLLIEIRQELLDSINFPFLFLNKDEDEIQKEKESEIKLVEILDGSILYLKKEKINRVMLGRKSYTTVIKIKNSYNNY